MTDAIYHGLLYGVIAGFTAFGFILTVGMLYGAINLIDQLHDWLIGENKHERHRDGR